MIRIRSRDSLVRDGRVDVGGAASTQSAEEEVVDRIVGEASSGHGGWLLTPNLEILRQHNQTPGVRRYFAQADLIVADGMPIVWASRHPGDAAARARRRRKRHPPDRGSRRRHRAADLPGRRQPGRRRGGRPQALRRQPEPSRRRFLLPAVGFEDDEAELAQIVRRLTEAGPAIVLMGLPFPRQERLIERLRATLPHAWFLGLGVSFSFVSGDVRRAPRWMQRSGIEWLFRLLSKSRGGCGGATSFTGSRFALRCCWAVGRGVCHHSALHPGVAPRHLLLLPVHSMASTEFQTPPRVQDPADFGSAEPPRPGPPDLGATLRRRWWIVLLLGALLAVAGAAVGRSQQQAFTAKSTLTVANVAYDTRSVPGFAQAAQSLASSYSQSIRGGPVIDRVSQDSSGSAGGARSPERHPRAELHADDDQRRGGRPGLRGQAEPLGDRRAGGVRPDARQHAHRAQYGAP